jgi:hypothetical protein
MLSSHLTRTSALLLGVSGFAFVFAPREMLALLAPGTPRTATWIGQLLGAALVGLACLNWFNRHTLLGGIYARAVVLANAMFYVVGASSVFGASAALTATRSTAQGVAAVLGVFAACYVWLLFRGPPQRDIASYRTSSSGTS